jgi:hypothetical protein
MNGLSNLRGYGLAVISCAVALAIAWPVEAPSSCFVLAVMFTSLYGGKGPSILAIGLSAFAFDYFFVLPRFHLLMQPSSFPRFAYFLVAEVVAAILIALNRRSEQARLEIHGRYGLVARTAPDAIITIGNDDRIRFINPATTRIFGWGGPELIGQPFSVLLPWFQLSDPLSCTECVGRRKDGSEFPVEISFAELAEGDQSTYTGFIRDISERKRHEAALKKSESFLAEAQKLSKTGSFAWNSSSGELFWSKEALRMAGYGPEVTPTLELLLERIHPEDRAKVEEILTRAAQSGEAIDFGHRFLLPDGSVKYVHVLAHTIDQGSGGVQYVGATMDITASVIAEEELRRTQAYLVEAEKLSHTGSWVWDVRLPGPMYWSAEMYRIHGLDPNGGPPSFEAYKALRSPEDWLELMNAIDRSVRDNVDMDCECRLRLADGSVKHTRVVGHPVANASGEVTQIIGTTIDVTEQQEAKAALEQALAKVRTSEDRLKRIINTIPALVWSARPDGTADYFNERWLAYTGAPAPNAGDWDWSRVVHPEDRARLEKHWSGLLASGKPDETEARLRRHDGVYRWFLLRCSPLCDESGNVIKWYGTNTDIEDLKRAEDALRASESNFRLIVDSVPGLVCTETPESGVELVNRQFLEYTGKTFEDARNWSTTGLVHEDDLSRVIDHWIFSNATGKTHDIEYRLRRADGVFRWFHVRGLASRDAGGTIVRWYYLFSDIEDRKNAEQALQASQRDLSLIIETIPALVWCAAPDGDLTYVNERVLEYTGATLNSVAMSRWTAFLHPDDVEATVRAWSQAVATGRPHDVQYRLRRADGAYRWFQVLGQPLRDKDGGIARWYGLLIDIEDRKNAEEALLRTQARLSRASQIAAVGELAASIAHEVNQPLSAVVANGHACLRWLLADPPNLPKAHQAAERIVRDGKEAGEVVRRVRALFRREPQERLTLDLNEVISEVLDLVRSEAARKRVSVETELGKDAVFVAGDRVQLQQLILNLLRNGMEAMDAIVNRPKKLFIRSVRQGDETVLIEIRDCGVGLPDPEKIFDAFFSTKENGLGMGLSICRSIIDAHHGRLWTRSEEPCGTTFCFTLPLLGARTALSVEG